MKILKETIRCYNKRMFCVETSLENYCKFSNGIFLATSEKWTCHIENIKMLRLALEVFKNSNCSFYPLKIESFYCFWEQLQSGLVNCTMKLYRKYRPDLQVG